MAREKRVEALCKQNWLSQLSIEKAICIRVQYFEIIIQEVNFSTVEHTEFNFHSNKFLLSKCEKFLMEEESLSSFFWQIKISTQKFEYIRSQRIFVSVYCFVIFCFDSFNGSGQWFHARKWSASLGINSQKKCWKLGLPRWNANRQHVGGIRSLFL